MEFVLSSAVGDRIGDRGDSNAFEGDVLLVTDGGDVSDSDGELPLSGISSELSFIFLGSWWCGNGDGRRREASTLRLRVTDGELNTSGAAEMRNGDRKEPSRDERC